MGGTSSAPTSRRASGYPGHRNRNNQPQHASVNNPSAPPEQNYAPNRPSSSSNRPAPTPRPQPSSTSSSGVQTMSRPGAYTIASTPTDSNSSSSPQVYRVQVPPNIAPNQEFQVYAGSRVVRVRCPANARAGSTIQISVANENGGVPRAGGRDETGELQQSAVLTTGYTGEVGGGAVRMTSEIRLFNDEQNDSQVDEEDEEDATTSPQNPPQRNNQTAYNVTVPPGVRPGSNFSVRIGTSTVQVQCPLNAGPGSVVRFVPPDLAPATDLTRAPVSSPTSNEPTFETVRQTFEVTVPEGVTPGRSFALMAGGQRVLVNCPINARPGQRIRFTLPLQRQLHSSQSGDNSSSNKDSTLKVSDTKMSYDTQDGWSRTTRITDMKFTWVRVDENGTLQETSDCSKTGLDVLHKMAYVRNIQFLKGNDPRMGTGRISLIPASDSSLASSLRRGDLNDPGGLLKSDPNKSVKQRQRDEEELVGYADLSDVQTKKSFEDKVNWFQTTCRDKLQVPWEQGHMRIAVRREHLLSDSVDAIMSLSPLDLRKIWRIDFLGEQGIDAGGLAKEFFELVTREIFDADNGLWLSANAENQMAMRINPASELSCPEDHLVYFRFLGRMMGRAMFGGYFVGGHMVQHLYKHILGWPVTFNDLEYVDGELYKTLKNLMEMDSDEVEHIGYDFTVTEERMGEKRVIELVEGGEQKELNGENRVEYLEAYLRYVMLDKVKLQLTELLLGFYDVVPQTLLTVFDFQELELVLCGMPEIDLKDWRENTVYTGTFKNEGGKHKVCRWFWEVVRDEFDREMKARLLQFVTGTSGVPTRGFEVLQGGDGNIKKFTIQGISLKDAMFPRAHTCFNRIDLPMYRSKQALSEKLKIAVTTCATGFTIE